MLFSLFFLIALTEVCCGVKKKSFWDQLEIQADVKCKSKIRGQIFFLWCKLQCGIWKPHTHFLNIASTKRGSKI